jgi:hypothetical protein
MATVNSTYTENRTDPLWDGDDIRGRIELSACRKFPSLVTGERVLERGAPKYCGLLAVGGAGVRSVTASTSWSAGERADGRV